MTLSRVTKHLLFSLLFMCAGSRLIPVPIAAGETLVNHERKTQELLTKTTAPLINDAHQPFLWDMGGWLNFRFDDYNDSDNNRYALDTLDDSWQFDLRTWVNALYHPIPGEEDISLQGYLRVKAILLTQQRPSFTQGELDADYLEIDNAFLRVSYHNLQWDFGRQYYSIGRGISYSDLHDGTQAWLLGDHVDLHFLATHTKPYEDNLDTSVPGYQHDSSRYYYGAEVQFRPAVGHQLYSYVLYEKDESNEYPEDTANQYTFGATFIGFGAEGSLAPWVSYWSEVIYETGMSYVFGTDTTKPVSAWATDLGLEFQPTQFRSASFFLEYAIGSGDANHSSVTNTQGGNLTGKDTNFLYFGYQSTGSVLAPRLSNLQFYRLGTSLKPFPKYFVFNLNRLEILFDVYHFLKVNPKGATSETEAVKSNYHLGFEYDLALKYEVSSDLSVTFEFGQFLPGSAYASAANDPESFLSLSTTLKF